MAKLCFRYGTVGSAKTMNLLAVAHNYRQQGKRVLIVQPKFDTRFGEGVVKSRSGLEEKADFILSDQDNIPEQSLVGVACILVDEAQFLSKNNIEHLREISWKYEIPIIAYGLRADFRGELFIASKRLFEIADSIEEIKTTCNFCNKKAVMNLRQIDGKGTLEGNSVCLGGYETFLPACYGCYKRETE